MKIDQLNYFLETARTEHIGKASRALRISPSAVSHSIAALEEELGRKLFLRKGKHIYLTSHGKRLMERAEALLREVESIRTELASDDVEYHGHYRVAAAHGLASRAITPACARLQGDKPRLTFEIFSLRSAQVLEGVLKGEFDLGLCFSPQDHPDLDCISVHTGQLVVAVAKSHPLLRSKSPDRLAKLAQFPAVLPKAFQGIEVCERHPVFVKFGIHPAVDLMFDNYEVAVEKVAISQAWSFLPEWILQLHGDRLRPLPLPKDWKAPYKICLVWSKNRLRPRALEALAAKVREGFDTVAEA